jgi:protein-tyrosine phosphatase
MDDGPEDIKGSLEMAGIAVDDGISHIFATPHIIDGLYDNKTREIAIAVDTLKRHIPASIMLLCGADARVTHDMINRVERGDIPTLSGSRYLLMEFPQYVLPPHMDDLIFNLRQRKIIPVITHPERHMPLMNDPSALVKLRASGALYQITAMSITGDFGRDARTFSLSMIEKGLADFVASDAHNPDRRPPVLSKAYRETERLFGSEIADRLFFHNPMKILNAVEEA